MRIRQNWFLTPFLKPPFLKPISMWRKPPLPHSSYRISRLPLSSSVIIEGSLKRCLISGSVVPTGNASKSDSVTHGRSEGQKGRRSANASVPLRSERYAPQTRNDQWRRDAVTMPPLRSMVLRSSMRGRSTLASPLFAFGCDAFCLLKVTIHVGAALHPRRRSRLPVPRLRGH